MSIHPPNSYIYTGGDGEKVPTNAQNVEYTAGISIIKKYAAEKCYNITSVIHPKSIIIIEDEAYSCCTAIDNLRLSSSLETIGVSSFYSCRSITILELPPTLHTIKKQGFFYCTSLREIVPQQQHEPLSLKAIEAGAFGDCRSLTSIPHLPFLVTIGPRAFFNCTSLTKVTLGPSLVTIGPRAFRNCDSLREIVPQQQHNPPSLKTIETEAFKHCTSLTSITHLPFLVTIGRLAFQSCRSLTEVTLGPSVTSAARNSFEDCFSLAVLNCTYHTHSILPWAVTDVTVHSDTTHIHASAFAGCDQLHSIVLTPAVASLGPSCFWGCIKLPTDFVVSNTVKNVGIGAFGRCTINSPNIPPHATHDIYTFVGGEGEMVPRGVEKVILDETVQVIKYSDFSYCEEITHLDIYSKDITIKYRVFNTVKLQVINFHINGILNIEQGAFFWLSTKNLRSVKFPSVVQLIIDGKFGNYAMAGYRPPIPAIHRNAFENRVESESSIEILQYCRRCSHLCQFWKWLDKKERQHCGMQRDSSQNSVYDCLCREDVEILQQVAKLVPPPPNDLIDAIVTDLHCHDLIFNKVPTDIIWKVVEYI